MNDIYLSHRILDSFSRLKKLLGINFKILILIFVENCLQFDAIHDILVWLSLIRRIVIGFEAILEKYSSSHFLRRER